MQDVSVRLSESRSPSLDSFQDFECLFTVHDGHHAPRSECAAGAHRGTVDRPGVDEGSSIALGSGDTVPVDERPTVTEPALRGQPTSKITNASFAESGRAEPPLAISSNNAVVPDSDAGKLHTHHRQSSQTTNPPDKAWPSNNDQHRHTNNGHQQGAAENYPLNRRQRYTTTDGIPSLLAHQCIIPRRGRRDLSSGRIKPLRWVLRSS